MRVVDKLCHLVSRTRAEQMAFCLDGMRMFLVRKVRKDNEMAEGRILSETARIRANVHTLLKEAISVFVSKTRKDRRRYQSKLEFDGTTRTRKHRIWKCKLRIST